MQSNDPEDYTIASDDYSGDSGPDSAEVSYGEE